MTMIQIDPQSVSVLVEAERGSHRHAVTGEVVVDPGIQLDRVRLAVVGRVGSRIVAFDDSGLDRDFILDGRLPFSATLVSRAGPLESIELRASLTGFVLAGSARVPAAALPSVHDQARAPHPVAAGDAHLAIQLRPDSSDVNIDVFGVLGRPVPGFMRGVVELVCLDAEEHPLFRDDSSFELGFGAPPMFKVVYWPKVGAWRATESVLMRIRLEVMGQAEAVVVPASAFIVPETDS